MMWADQPIIFITEKRARRQTTAEAATVFLLVSIDFISSLEYK